MRLFIIAAIAVFALAGCKSTDTQTAAPIDDKGTGTTTAVPDSTTTKGVGGTGVTGTAGAIAPHKDPANMLSQKRSIYFDYDQFTIKDEFKATVEGHAKYVQGNRTLRIILQGNTDERGTREYNYSLGARRAQTARDYLASRGIAGNRMRTISYGKERPVAVCNDISCWSQNRRAVTVLDGAGGV